MRNKNLFLNLEEKNLRITISNLSTKDKTHFQAHALSLFTFFLYFVVCTLLRGVKGQVLYNQIKNTFRWNFSDLIIIFVSKRFKFHKTIAII